MNRVRVAVTGMHLGENSQPGPGVVESLRHAMGERLHVVGLGYDAFDSGLHADGLLDEAFLLPYPSSGPDAFVARLLQVHAAAPFDVLIPCLDVELPVLLRAEARLLQHGIQCVLPDAASLSRCSKVHLPELAAKCGLRTPPTRRVADLREVTNAGHEFGYPLVVKGPFYEAEVAQGPGEASAAFARLSARWGLPLLAQQFVVGEEFDVVALGDGQALRGAVAMRKTMVTRLGKAWGGVTVHDDELLDAARTVLGELRWRGGCEVEMLRGRADDELYLIEFNPRFPAWVHLSTAAGVNLPLCLLQLARGEALAELPPPRLGVWYVRHAQQLFGDQRDLEALLATSRRRAAEVTP